MKISNSFALVFLALSLMTLAAVPAEAQGDRDWRGGGYHHAYQGGRCYGCRDSWGRIIAGVIADGIERQEYYNAPPPAYYPPSVIYTQPAPYYPPPVRVYPMPGPPPWPPAYGPNILGYQVRCSGQYCIQVPIYGH